MNRQYHQCEGLIKRTDLSNIISFHEAVSGEASDRGKEGVDGVGDHQQRAVGSEVKVERL